MAKDLVTRTPVFEERQWFIQVPWFWIVLVVVGIAGGMAVRSDARSAWVLLLMPVVATIHLRTRLDDRLELLFWPIWRRRLDVASIQAAAPYEYRAMRFGGWGVRWGDRAIAYTVWGRGAVRLRLSGRDLVVGSRDPQRFLAALDSRGVAIERRLDDRQPP